MYLRFLHLPCAALLGGLLLVAAPPHADAAIDAATRCNATRLKAAGKMCKKALKCTARFAKAPAKDPGGVTLDGCLGSADLAYRRADANARSKARGRCSLAQPATAVGERVQDFAEALLADVWSGADADDKIDRDMRAALLQRAGAQCVQSANAFRKLALQGDVDRRKAEVAAASSRFDGAAAKLIAKASARSVFYDGVSRTEIRQRVQRLTDQLAMDGAGSALEYHEHILKRAGYGPGDWSSQRIRELGARFYLEEQLHPETIDETAVDDYIATEFPGTGMKFFELRANYRTPKFGDLPTAHDLLTELAWAKIVRSIRGHRQLESVLVDFFFNHFNVFASDRDRRWDIVPYERDSIRPFVWGRFADLVVSVARSPAMLDYLDNSLNQAGFVNENYARELMELHTVSVEGGYTQADVIEVARALTGWRKPIIPNVPASQDYRFSSDPDATGFIFDARVHDFGAKSFFAGQLSLPGGGGEQDGIDVIEFLTSRPEAAGFLCRKLVMRFIADEPPLSAVDRCVETYLATGGVIRDVVRTILLSPELNADLDYRGSKAKRPLVFFSSLFRLLEILPEDDLERTRFLLASMGEDLYLAPPPTGYGDDSDEWASPGGVLERLDVIRALARGDWGFELDFGIDAGSDAVLIDHMLARFHPAGVPQTWRQSALTYMATIGNQSPRVRVENAAIAVLTMPSSLHH